MGRPRKADSNDSPKASRLPSWRSLCVVARSVQNIAAHCLNFAKGVLNEVGAFTASACSGRHEGSMTPSEGKRQMPDRKPAPGEKMIQIKVRLMTNSIAAGGKIRPKHAWTNGTIGIEQNPTHGIAPSHDIPFNSLLELPTRIEQLLIRESITLHPNRKMRKYIKP